jgi:uncharacterized membrane protein
MRSEIWDLESLRSEAMQGLATVHHHPIHPALIPFPLAFWFGSGGADVIHEATKDPFWSRAAGALIDAGIAGALGSAVFGFVDYLTVPMSRQAKRAATLHLLANLGLVGLYSANYVVRARNGEEKRWPGYALSAAGLALLTYAGWLGGTLSFEYHVGTEEPAHDATERVPQQSEQGEAA